MDHGTNVKQRVKRTRKVKESLGLAPTPKTTEVSRVKSNLEKFNPTAKQKEFIQLIEDNTAVFVDSVAGTGKTSATLWYFCKEYLTNPHLQIVVVRTPVEIGLDKVGFLPADLNSKLAVHFDSTKKILSQFLGKEKVEADLDLRIKFMPVNYALGATYDNTLMLMDEVQQWSPAMLKLMLERIGKNTKVVIAGSSDQLLGTGANRDALKDARRRFINSNGVIKYPDIAFFEFDVEDCQRSEFVKDVVRAYSGGV